MRMDRRKAVTVYIIACVNTVTIGFSYLAAKVSLRSGSPVEALFFRFAIGFAFALAVLFVIKRRSGRPAEKGKRKWGLLIPAVLYSGGFFGFQFFGLLYASSVEAGIIMAVQPMLTMVIAEFAIKEKPTLLQRLCIFAAIVSAAFISAYGAAGSDGLDMRGVVLIFLSALCMSANVVFIRWKRGEYTPVEISFSACAFGFVLYSAAVVIRGLANGSLGDTLMLVTEPSFLASTAYLGIACTMLTNLMNSYLMIYLEAIKVSVFSSAGTVITLLSGYFILNEDLSPVKLLCAAVILTCVVVINYRKPDPVPGGGNDGKA